MTGKFTNNLQAALLYDGLPDVIPGQDLKTFRAALNNIGIPFRIVQENVRSVFMMGPDELQLTCTYFDRPADQAVLAAAANSPVARMRWPDVQERVRRHRSHVLIEIQQGVLGGVEDDQKIASFLEQVGMPRAGRDLASFNRRVNILGDACVFLQKEKPASMMHWTQSNALLSPEGLDVLLSEPGPGFLTIHPMLFGGAPVPGFRETPVEIYTIGAADYIGREIHVDLAPIPWVDLYGGILSFVKMATMPNGYIIPDGDTFGIETGEFSWKVTHLDGATQKTVNGQPCFNLKLLYHRPHGYTDPDFTGRERVKGGIWEAAAELEATGDVRQKQVASWERTQEMAERAGARFEIYRREVSPKAPGGSDGGSTPRFGSSGGRGTAVFGKRKN